MTTLRSLASSLLRLDGHANIAADRHHARPRPPAHPKAASTCMNTTLPGPWQTHELVGAVISEWSRFCSPQMRLISLAPPSKPTALELTSRFHEAGCPTDGQETESTSVTAAVVREVGLLLQVRPMTASRCGCRDHDEL
jgi:hypothetical protein